MHLTSMRLPSVRLSTVCRGFTGLPLAALALAVACGPGKGGGGADASAEATLPLGMACDTCLTSTCGTSNTALASDCPKFGECYCAKCAGISTKTPTGMATLESCMQTCVSDDCAGLAPGTATCLKNAFTGSCASLCPGDAGPMCDYDAGGDEGGGGEGGAGSCSSPGSGTVPCTYSMTPAPPFGSATGACSSFGATGTVDGLGPVVAIAAEGVVTILISSTNLASPPPPGETVFFGGAQFQGSCPIGTYTESSGCLSLILDSSEPMTDGGGYNTESWSAASGDEPGTACATVTPIVSHRPVTHPAPAVGSVTLTITSVGKGDETTGGQTVHGNYSATLMGNPDSKGYSYPIKVSIDF